MRRMIILLPKTSYKFPPSMSKLMTNLSKRKGWMWYHQHLGHASFNKMQQMAREGIIPYRLLEERIPNCLYCIKAKATQRPLRTSKQGNKSTMEITPGSVVSVVQLSSNTLGYVAQM